MKTTKLKAFARSPNLWSLAALVEHNRFSGVRPEGFPSLSSAFRLAWMVFTGRADALVWPEDWETKADE